MSQIAIVSNKIYENKKLKLLLNLIVKNNRILEDIFLTFENESERKLVCKNDFEVKQFTAFVREFSRRSMSDFEENKFLSVVSRQLTSGDLGSIQKSLSLKNFKKVYISRVDAHTCTRVIEDAIKGFSRARRSRQNSLVIFRQDVNSKRIQYTDGETKDIYLVLKEIYIQQYQKGTFNEALETVAAKDSVLYSFLER